MPTLHAHESGLRDIAAEGPGGSRINPEMAKRPGRTDE